jgi:hypothetical protein
MGGIDGSLLEVVVEILGIDDVETLLTHLCAIRDRQGDN